MTFSPSIHSYAPSPLILSPHPPINASGCPVLRISSFEPFQDDRVTTFVDRLPGKSRTRFADPFAWIIVLILGAPYIVEMIIRLCAGGR